MRTFARFDKDGSGFIEANEMASLKKFFTIEEVDVNVQDGKIDKIELLAALNNCSIEEARAAYERYGRPDSSDTTRGAGPSMSFAEQVSKTFSDWFSG